MHKIRPLRFTLRPHVGGGPAVVEIGVRRHAAQTPGVTGPSGTVS
jgi:hypothetical protein